MLRIDESIIIEVSINAYHCLDYLSASINGTLVWKTEQIEKSFNQQTDRVLKLIKPYFSDIKCTYNLLFLGKVRRFNLSFQLFMCVLNTT